MMMYVQRSGHDLVAGSFADQISAQRTRYLVDVPDFSHNLVTFGGQISGRGCLHQIIWCRGRQISGTRPHQPPDSSQKQAPDIWLRTTGQISPQSWAEYLVTAAADIWPTRDQISVPEAGGQISGHSCARYLPTNPPWSTTQGTAYLKNAIPVRPSR